MKNPFCFVIGTLAAVTTSLCIYKTKKNHQKKTERDLQKYNCTAVSNLPLQNKLTDYKDSDHLIFCDESQLDKRIIQLETTINMRDIGGYTGLNGRKTRWGKIIRSEELVRLSDNDVDYLTNIGVKHVYDFRDENKARKNPDRMPLTADYLNLPVLKSMPKNVYLDYNDPDGINQFMRKIYAFQVQERAQDFAVVLHALANDETPILYHCTNGKDRTGFMTALILLICGVPDETIISDYTLTNLTFDESFEILGTIMAEEKEGIPKEAIRDFFGVCPSWLKIQLDYIHENYESIDDYLLKNTDLTTEDLYQIRNVMLEPVSE